MNELSHKDRVRDFYDIVSPYFSALWGPHLHDGYYAWGAKTKEAAQEDLVAHLASSAAVPRGSRGLDVGCGLGATAVWLARERSCRMLGVTLSSVQVEMARELAQREGVDAEFLVGDAEKLTFDEEFDFLWMVGVLGHLRDQRAFLNASPRLLRGGGLFVLGDWVADPDLDERDRRRYVDPVIEGMLMPDIATLPDYAAWFEESGYKVRAARDLTDATRKTWDEGIRISQVPELYKIARGVGRDAVGLLRAIRGMRQAMSRGLIRYGVVIAEKLPSA